MKDRRIEREIEHGKHLREIWVGTLRYWETPAGKIRWQRRLKMLTGHVKTDMKVLEVGCGVGYFTEELAKTNADITAIDISPDLLKVAQGKINGYNNVRLKLENAYEMSFPNHEFDSIIGSAILHHLDIDLALREFYRVIKPGGTLFFTEPNMLNPQIFLQKNIPVLKKWAGDSPDETAFIRFGLTKALIKYGFEDIYIMPFDFLHPETPRILIPIMDKLGEICEEIPIIKEVGGSLYIHARKNIS